MGHPTGGLTLNLVRMSCVCACLRVCVCVSVCVCVCVCVQYAWMHAMNVWVCVREFVTHAVCPLSAAAAGNNASG